jgi:flagellar FliJ protein
MKKFRFSLETVMEYKQQILDSLQTEHGAILAKARRQEALIEELEAAYRHLAQEFNRRKLEGISILDAMKYEQYLRSSERQEEAYQHLAELQKQEEAKRDEVVEAKKETSSIEKLREKKLEGYNKAVQKSEEAMIDEFVMTRRAMEAQSA